MTWKGVSIELDIQEDANNRTEPFRWTYKRDGQALAFGRCANLLVARDKLFGAVLTYFAGELDHSALLVSYADIRKGDDDGR